MIKVSTLCISVILLGTIFLFSTMCIKSAFAEKTLKNNSNKSVNFVLLRPDTEHPFWELFEHAMKSSCHDIGCIVDVKYANWDHYRMIEQAQELGALKNKPDMVFFQSFKSNGVEIIKALDAAGIKGFLVNAGLTVEQSLMMGKPREKYKNWIGQMMPDDFGAGRSTAEALYKAAKEKGLISNGKVILAGIEGNSADGASIERLKGLRSVAEQYDDFEILQVVQGKWDSELSKQQAKSLMRRYPNLNVIWTAGDPMALGVIDALKDIGDIGERSILTAGVDWAPRALKEIKKGTMIGSAGGHFMEGAWAAIVAYDYIKGIDFIKTVGVEMKSKMGFLNQDNLPSYSKNFGEGNFDSVDFKEFSQYYGAKNNSYDFDISVLFTKINNK